MATHSGPSDYVSVAQFFHDRSVFVTGGTGFMGKVLVEKLLWSCPGIKNIYLLMRSKKGQDVAARLAELINAPLFDRLRKERPLELNKIVPITGDITEPELGISQSDQNLLIRTVSIVFHSAATVKFDEALKLSVTINMLGTKQLVELCHRMLSLEALIHVSTAYCNCDREEVSEVIYPPPYDPEKIIQCMEWMDDDLIQALTPKLIGNRPNTYTFTKALAESMLLKESGNLPVAIVRPSIGLSKIEAISNPAATIYPCLPSSRVLIQWKCQLSSRASVLQTRRNTLRHALSVLKFLKIYTKITVLSAYREPVAGWVDNWNGPTGLIAAAGKGFFRTMLCHENKVADLVPVDMVINLMICAAWRTATARPDGIAVYNCCTGLQRPVTWKEFVDLCFVFMRKHPFGSLVWYPDGRCRSNWAMNTLCSYTLHTFPAYVLDLFIRLSGKKPYMVNVQGKLDKASKCLEYFSTQQWRFKDDNVRQLITVLSSEDRQTFHFDVQDINWSTYIENYVLGIRHFIFKEHPSSLPKARKQLQKLFWVHRMTQLMAVLLMWRALMMRSSTARRMWFVMLDMILRIARLIPYV